MKWRWCSVVDTSFLSYFFLKSLFSSLTDWILKHVLLQHCEPKTPLMFQYYKEKLSPQDSRAQQSLLYKVKVSLRITVQSKKNKKKKNPACTKTQVLLHLSQARIPLCAKSTPGRGRAKNWRPSQEAISAWLPTPSPAMSTGQAGPALGGSQKHPSMGTSVSPVLGEEDQEGLPSKSMWGKFSYSRLLVKVVAWLPRSCLSTPIQTIIFWQNCNLAANCPVLQVLSLT